MSRKQVEDGDGEIQIENNELLERLIVSNHCPKCHEPDSLMLMDIIMEETCDSNIVIDAFCNRCHVEMFLGVSPVGFEGVRLPNGESMVFLKCDTHLYAGTGKQ